MMMNMLFILAEGGGSLLFTGLLQTILVAVASFVISVLLVSHIRYQKLTLEAMGDGVSRMNALEAFRIRVANYLGGMHRQPEPFSILLFTLDDLPTLEAECDEEEIDSMMQFVLGELKDALREDDATMIYDRVKLGLVARIDRDFLEGFLDRLSRTTLQEAYRTTDGTLKKLGLKIGVATFPDNGESVDELMDAASQALEVSIDDSENPWFISDAVWETIDEDDDDEDEAEVVKKVVPPPAVVVEKPTAELSHDEADAAKPDENIEESPDEEAAAPKKRKRFSLTKPEEDDEEDEGVAGEEEAAPPKKRKRFTLTKSEDPEEDDEEDEEDETVAVEQKPAAPKKRKRFSLTKSEDPEEEDEDHDEESAVSAPEAQVESDLDTSAEAVAEDVVPEAEAVTKRPVSSSRAKKRKRLSLVKGAGTGQAESADADPDADDDDDDEDEESSAAQARLVDELTGVLSSNYSGAATQKYIARYRKDEHPVSLLYIDIDGLEQYNSHYGRKAGDVILRSLGQLLQETVREDDIIGRVGGEEFVICMATKPQNALVAARRICNDVKKSSVMYAGNKLRYTVCIGVAGFPDHGGVARSLFERAMISMRAAKYRGRSMFEIYNPKMRSSKVIEQETVGPSDAF